MLSVIAVPVFPPNPNRRDTLQMFAKIVQACEPAVALCNKEYNHLKKLSTIRDMFAKLKGRTSDWPDNLEWVPTDTKQGKSLEQHTIKQVLATSRDVAFLQFTSGSTSEPKGVIITHGNLAHNLTIITSDLEATDDTIVVSWLPQYHDMGLIGSYLGVLYCGGSGFYMSPLSFLQRPMLWIEAVSRYKATHLQAPNFAFKLTARKFQSSDYSKDSLDLSSVRHVINAAEPVDEESIETFYQSFGPFGFQKVIFPTYGLAEHTVFVCSGGKQRIVVDKETLETKGLVVTADSNAPTDTVSKLIGCGYPARQGVDVRIVQLETLEELPEGNVGEIWINSPSKAAGYYNKSEETERDFHGQIKGTNNESGYLRTGDLGCLLNTELFICGRLKDLIIVGGRNYYPQDIEATAESTSEMLRPGCAAAFTIDLTNAGGEEVALILELKEAPPTPETANVCDPLANAIKSAVNQEHSLGLAQIVFLLPRSVPKTSSGKIARSWCRKAFVAGTLNVVYRKNFATTSKASLEIEPNDTSSPLLTSSPRDAQAIRALSKNELLSRLIADVAKVGSMPVETIDKDAALVTILNSLDLSQFKGLFENKYACKISDEYMFRDTTTLSKLADIARLGHAPDDQGGNQASGQRNSQAMIEGNARGLAGALGCPPGVRCSIM